MTPLVSILIPVYNAHEWVATAIESALGQTWVNKEVIVVDDCSTDESWEVIQSFAGRVQFERAAQNGGQNVTRNRLTELSHGEWLVYLDADDELMPNSVAEKVHCSEKADAVYGSMEERWFVDRAEIQRTTREAVDHSDQLIAAFWWTYPNTSSFMFRRSAIAAIDGWNVEVKNCTDYELLFRLLLQRRLFRPARDSWSIYRHWSEAQAIYEIPERLLKTRLKIMWQTAREVESNGELSPARRTAFEQASFGCIRALYKTDKSAAVEAHSRLLNWNPEFVPRSRTSTRYTLAYKLGGFKFAERMASIARPINPAAA